MAQTSHIKRRGSTYYAQVAVPLDLQPIMNRKTMDRSLRTKDPREAKRLVRPVLDEWDRMFDEAHRQAALAIEQRQPLSVAQIAMRDYKSQIAFDAELRDADHRWAQIGVDHDEARRFRDGYSGILSDDQLDEIVGARVSHHMAAIGQRSPKGSDEWRTIAQALCASTYEARSRQDERDGGDFTGTPTHPLLIDVEPEAVAAEAGEGIMDLYDLYARENAKGITQDTLTQARRDVKLFVDTTGGIPASEIDKKLVRNWKALLMDYPVKAAEIAVFRGMTMKQIIEANVAVKKPTITDRTVNRYLSSLGAFCDWLSHNDYLDRNPVDGFSQKVDKTKRSQKPFSVDQMNTLFASPLFTGCRNDDDWHLPGNHAVRDHRYWLPLVMLYSGARPAEIAQLGIDDVREQHGSWIIHITTEGGDDKSTKTKGSMRVVPVHPELVKLGFVKYREAVKAKGEARLFPQAVRNQRGQMVADFSRDFGRYLTRIGIKAGRGLSLYSFRHGFIDALRRAEYLDEQFGFLVGHKAHSMTEQYGTLPQGMLRQRVEMIEAVAYPRLNLEHLTI
ncbi:integrase [Mesorhizobium huakuii]|uniref:site-specific integrase n=1 Tax=Mesorhizobium huakuii TaxID=28104 RepID=UPI00235C9B26|nr:site-specific integrase [Mesorhizobium huakuii]GLQ82025.1 integrase [Mesorhizobium huakuii]